MAGVLKIYGDKRSGNCLKCLWVANRVGQKTEWIDVDIFKGESRTRDFLALNPAGQVPTAILPDGRALAQSNAIMLQLAETYGSDLIPHDAFARAKMYEWLFWEQYNHEPSIAVRRALIQFRGKSESEIDPALLEKGNACLARMELQMALNTLLDRFPDLRLDGDFPAPRILGYTLRGADAVHVKWN